jgi:hypothetical protein
MSRAVFLHRPDVQNGHLASPNALYELIPVHGFHAFFSFKELTLDLLDLGQSAFGQHPHGAKEITDSLVGQAIANEQSLLLGLHQPVGPKNLQMLGSVGHGQARFPGQNFDRPFALAEKVQQFQPFWAGDCFPDAGELCIDIIFEGAVWIFHVDTSIIQ